VRLGRKAVEGCAEDGAKRRGKEKRRTVVRMVQKKDGGRGGNLTNSETTVRTSKHWEKT